VSNNTVFLGFVDHDHYTSNCLYIILILNRTSTKNKRFSPLVDHMFDWNHYRGLYTKTYLLTPTGISIFLSEVRTFTCRRFEVVTFVTKLEGFDTSLPLKEAEAEWWLLSSWFSDSTFGGATHLVHRIFRQALGRQIQHRFLNEVEMSPHFRICVFFCWFIFCVGQWKRVFLMCFFVGCCT